MQKNIDQAIENMYSIALPLQDLEVKQKEETYESTTLNEFEKKKS